MDANASKIQNVKQNRTQEQAKGQAISKQTKLMAKSKTQSTGIKVRSKTRIAIELGGTNIQSSGHTERTCTCACVTVFAVHRNFCV